VTAGDDVRWYSDVERAVEENDLTIEELYGAGVDLERLRLAGNDPEAVAEHVLRVLGW
jgi:hypothetical protein